MVEKYFFEQNFCFPRKYETSGPEWYIQIDHTPKTPGARVFKAKGILFLIINIYLLIILFFLYIKSRIVVAHINN